VKIGKKSGPPPKKGPASQGIQKLRGGGEYQGGSASSSSGSKSSGSTSSGGGRDLGYQQRGMSKSDYAKSTQTQNFGGRDSKTNTVTARPGPTRLPVIGPTTYLANKFLEARYNRKNLQEQKKEDVLGGEMLTQGKKIAPAPMGGGRDNGGPQPIQLSQTKVASTSTVPIPLMKVQPKTFDFEYKEGGLVRGSGKVLKGRVKKAKIY
jgi:hypothetical protein